jgi:DNA-binding beta-propeller fold protein YncE
MVAGFGALWVTNGDSNGSVSRINPATGTVTRTLTNVPDVTAAAAGSLWGTGNYGGLYRVDPATGRVTTTSGPKNAVRVIFWAGSAGYRQNHPAPSSASTPHRTGSPARRSRPGHRPPTSLPPPMGCG